jgi:hypothetical protein
MREYITRKRWAMNLQDRDKSKDSEAIIMEFSKPDIIHAQMKEECLECKKMLPDIKDQIK